VKADPSSSEAQDLLGRAYGLTAQKSSLLEQVRLAKAARACFARAVELDPGNVAALSDLARYDMRAPGVLGGGKKKSRATIDRVLALDAERGNVLLGELSEIEKKPADAEAAYRRALAACPDGEPDRRAGIHERLAGVYERLGRNREAAAELEAALDLEPDRPEWRRRLARLEK
jgi:tetratricopeptide (TPR) repeat protein